MSDINKLVAAILTAGRMPAMSPEDGRTDAGDWLAEYAMWVDMLDKRDAQATQAADHDTAVRMVNQMSALNTDEPVRT